MQVTPEDVEDSGGRHRWSQATWVAWPDPTLLSQMHRLRGTVTGTWPMVSDTPSVPPGHPLGGTLGTREGYRRNPGTRRDLGWEKDPRGWGTPGTRRDPGDEGDPKDQEGTPRGRRGFPGMGQGSQRPAAALGMGEGPQGWRKDPSTRSDPRDRKRTRGGGTPGTKRDPRGGSRLGSGSPPHMAG